MFICSASEFIHLGAVSGMTTDCFILALHRFIDLRGLWSDIHSHCGTNFVGGHNALKSNAIKFRAEMEQDIVPLLADERIQWHFNSSRSPNFGGIWEANLKAVKFNLNRILDGTSLTFEELSSVLARIESCLKPRRGWKHLVFRCLGT